MGKKTLETWITVAGFIGILFGIFYAFFGLEGFPAYNELISKDVIDPWSNGLYGSTFIGFSVFLLLGGRHAIKKNDKTLMKIMLYGIFSWLIVEASFSLYYSVFFNLSVDALLAIFLGLPFIKGLKTNGK